MRKGLTHGAIEPPGATGAHTILIDRLLSCRLGVGVGVGVGVGEGEGEGRGCIGSGHASTVPSCYTWTSSLPSRLWKLKVAMLMVSTPFTIMCAPATLQEHGTQDHETLVPPTHPMRAARSSASPSNYRGWVHCPVVGRPCRDQGLWLPICYQFILLLHITARQHSTHHSTPAHITAQHTSQHASTAHITAHQHTAPARQHTSQHSTPAHSTARQHTAHHSTPAHSTAQHASTQHSTLAHSTAR